MVVTLAPNDLPTVIIFVLNWLLLIKRKWSFIPLGRPGSALTCCVLLVVTGYAKRARSSDVSLRQCC
jgi:hypothetical protein